MRAELPAFSFLSVFFLILILPGQLKCNTIPAVSIISWLFVCNIIHGVNSVVWANNADAHAVVWCDIATVVLLGAMVAVPGAFLCISRQLDLMTTRTDPGLKPVQPYKKVFEILMCMILPVIYMALHPIVQDHRFTILHDLGCQAAVYNSFPALILIWLPPLLISGVAVMYCLSAAVNVGKAHYTSSPYFPYTPEMTMSLFGRRFVLVTLGMLYVLIIYLLVASSVALQTWTNVSQTRALVSQIEIAELSRTRFRSQSELIWWSVPILSLLLCVMYGFGEETKKGYRSIFNWFSRRLEKDVLPTHSKSLGFVNTRPEMPIHLLKSGWDDALNLKKSHRSLRSNFTLKSKGDSTRSSTPSSPVSPPPVSPGQDASFTQSTLNYLESDTARQLHLPSPPPVAQFPSPASPKEANTLATLAPPNPHHSADMSGSPASSILSSTAWPQPPPTIPSPVSAHPYARSESPTSVRSSITSSIAAGRLDPLGYPFGQVIQVAPPRMRNDLPFSVGSPGMISVPFLPPTPRRSTSAHSSKSRNPYRVPTHLGKSKKNDAIYMTVVKETVVGDA